VIINTVKMEGKGKVEFMNLGDDGFTTTTGKGGKKQ
jgi:hypothetical protein